MSSLGLTQMYRLAYRLRIGDLIDQTSRDHRPDPLEGEEIEDLVEWPPPVDFTEALFGYVRSHRAGGEGVRGRVNVGLFRCSTDIAPANEERCQAVLNGPKPTYYPSYVDQGHRLDASGTRVASGEYLTYMDGEAEIRGWKRYPVRPQAELPPPPAREASENVSVTWWTIPSQSRFAGRIRVHNLRPLELGALLWALDFGGSPGHFHSLGLAKPFGFGRVRLEVSDAGGLRQTKDGSQVDLAGARESFLEHMRQAIPNWTESEQLIQLLAMANPAAAQGHELSYMSLGQHRNENEFVEAKKPQNCHVLPPYAPFAGARDRNLYPRGEAAQRWQTRLQKVRQEARRRKAEAEEAREGERREAIGPGGRVREDFRELLELPLEDQVDGLLGMSRELPADEAVDPAAWARALAEAFAPALEEVRRRAAGRGSPRLQLLEDELAQHLEKKPADKKSKPFDRWKRKELDLTRKVELARAADGAAQRRAAAYGELLAWLDGLAVQEEPQGADPSS